MNEHELLACKLVAAPLGELKAGSIAEWMIMPAGEQTGTFHGQAGPVTRTVQVDRGSAQTLNEQLAAVSARSKQRPFFDFDHEDKAASAWPIEYIWRDSGDAGVYVRAEVSQAGADSINGKMYRGFSPRIWVSKSNPARVRCNPDADLNFGGLVNDPAFRELSPLWAKNAAGAQQSSSAQADQQNQKDKMNAEQLAALQAKITTLEQDIVALKAKSATDATSAIELRAKQAELAASKAGLEVEQLRAQNAALETERKAGRTKNALSAIALAVARGAIPAANEELKAKWQTLLEAGPANEVLLAAMPGTEALTQGITRQATAAAAGSERLQAKEGPARVIKAYEELVAKNSAIRPAGYANFERKGELAREMALIYKRDIGSRLAEFDGMPLAAADYTDPNANLGTLSGTLVAQRTLELFKMAFPVLSRITTDFSDMPAQFKQTIATRVVMVPSVQTYDPTLVNGRPNGWTNVVATAQTTDVLITLDEHVGVPIVFDANTLASTIRRLFDEMAPAASYSLAKYFVEKIYKLWTPANYNAYAAKNGAKVPTAYANYPVGIGDFARSTMTKLAAIFNPNEVPVNDRSCLLNSPYFEQLACDPSLVTFFAGQRAPEIVTDNQLPKLGGFMPIEAPNLNAPNVTPNLVGMALHKAGAVAMTRLSNDYTQALPGSSYGSVTTIRDPDIGISVVLVQYVNHTGGYAEWRLQVMLGAGVGDKRGGLCITSQ